MIADQGKSQNLHRRDAEARRTAGKNLTAEFTLMTLIREGEEYGNP
jgi:hypothetical protein